MLIETDRLTMAQITNDDWPLFLRLNTDPSIISLCFDIPSESEIRAKFQSRLPLWNSQSNEWLCLVIREKNSAMAVGITGFFIDNSVAEVGYLLLPEFHGRQYGTESLSALIDRALALNEIVSFRAVVTEGNIASERVLQKCGFTLSQVIPQAYSIAGKRYDDRIYLKG